MRFIYIAIFLGAFCISGHITEAATTTPSLPTSTNNSLVEKTVRDYFKGTPVMIEIARCESKFRQYTDAGNVLRSNGMIGVFQFYESIHAPLAKARGIDLATTAGNLDYAKYLYETEGTTPWNGSKYCWGTSATTTPTTISTKDRAALLEQIAILTKLIALLQKQLALKQALALR